MFTATDGRAHAPNGAGLFAPVKEQKKDTIMLESLRRRLAYWWVVHETTRKLRFLDDYLLADLGIERRDIDCIAVEATAARHRGR